MSMPCIPCIYEKFIHIIHIYTNTSRDQRSDVHTIQKTLWLVHVRSSYNGRKPKWFSSLSATAVVYTVYNHSTSFFEYIFNKENHIRYIHRGRKWKYVYIKQAKIVWKMEAHTKLYFMWNKWTVHVKLPMNFSEAIRIIVSNFFGFVSL